GGEDIAAHFAFADARADWRLTPDRFHAFFAPAGVFAAIPLPREGYWRLLAQVDRRPDAAELTLDFFEKLSVERAGEPVRLSDPPWITAFDIPQRIVAARRDRRIFLAGDAAHNHSPVGGQGMNYGIQDAYNLGWKLASVLAGPADAALLDS